MNSELRQDLVSGDWIVVAPKRAERPEQFLEKTKRKKSSVKGCPFEAPSVSDHGEPVLRYGHEGDWTVQIVQNKFPAFRHNIENACAVRGLHGPYKTVEGIGHHDIVIPRSHSENIPCMDIPRLNLVFKAFRERYNQLANDLCSAYVSIFHNWGPKAGASIYHPHFQIITLPIIPPDVEHSLEGSAEYFRNHKKCVHCVMLEWEFKEKGRIIFENEVAIAFTPFVSREPFEVRIFPKTHSPFFEVASEESLKGVAEALQYALTKIEKNLGDPDYNFFIHTAPIHNKEQYYHYHWHIEIQPKISISAGFELGTGIEITAVDPDEAAQILRK